MCASRCVRVAIVITRTYVLLYEYRIAPPSEFLLAFLFHSLHETAGFARFRLCVASASRLGVASSAFASASAFVAGVVTRARLMQPRAYVARVSGA